MRGNALPTPIAGQDTHDAHNKAPIRSPTTGAWQCQGNAGPQSTSQRQGTSANPSTSQAGPVVHHHRILSIPAISPPAHARFETVRLAEAPPIITSVLRALV